MGHGMGLVAAEMRDSTPYGVDNGILLEPG
jgi:hypothetical protein